MVYMYEWSISMASWQTNAALLVAFLAWVAFRANDVGIVEAIADNATAITARVFPQRDDGASVAVRLEGRVASDAPCEITANFTVWALDPIWAGA